MKRNFILPLIVLGAALVLMLVDNWSSHDSGEKVPINKKENGPVSFGDGLSFTASIAEEDNKGILELKITSVKGAVPEKLEGTVTLIELIDDENDGMRHELEITSAYMKYDSLEPGRYRLEAEVDIPNTEYTLIQRPLEIEILEGKTITHSIVIPDD